MTTLDICLLQWNTYNTRMQKVFETISDENFNKPITSNGNSPSWIMGHLADTDDALLELFGIGSRKHPELKTIYHHEKGTNQTGHLSKSDLMNKWKSITGELIACRSQGFPPRADSDAVKVNDPRFFR
ncbi:MAG: DinB family protein [Bacteroidetes bacterium]|nr:DinB family protein [Bacteroidota bacterium]